MVVVDLEAAPTAGAEPLPTRARDPEQKDPIAEAKELAWLCLEDEYRLRQQSRKIVLETRPEALVELRRLALHGKSEKIRCMACDSLVKIAERADSMPLPSAPATPGAVTIERSRTVTATDTEKVTGVLAPGFRL